MDYTPCWYLDQLPTKEQKKYIGKNNTLPKYFTQMIIDLRGLKNDTN